MSRTILPALALFLLISGILAAGCSTPAARPPVSTAPPGNGTLHVSTVPAGADVYLDGEYWSPSPSMIAPVPAGHHTLEFRRSGYENLTYPVTVVAGGMEGISVELVSIQTIVLLASGATPASGSLPRVTVDGSWTYGSGMNKSADPSEGKHSPDPVPFIVHVEATNAGTAGAREVTALVKIYNEGQIVCQVPVDLGAIAAGSQVTRDVPVSCTIPTGYVDRNIVVLCENVVVRQ
jgi:hypothetical protein